MEQIDFRKFYDHPISDDWKTMVVLQQLLALVDESQLVVVTIDLHRRTGIPKHFFTHGIKELQAMRYIVPLSNYKIRVTDLVFKEFGKKKGRK